MPTFSAVRVARRLIAPMVLLIAATLGACRNFTSIDASFANVTDSDTVYALNGSAPGAPNAIRFFDGVIRPADQTFGFDIAFDINEDGLPVILPVRAVASGFSGPYRVGVQTSAGPFESVVSAPRDGYRLDSAYVVLPGQTVILESHDLNICAYSIKGNSYFSKVVITHIDVAQRKMAITVTVNRNCGFRSFEPGIPRD